MWYVTSLSETKEIEKQYGKKEALGHVLYFKVLFLASKTFLSFARKGPIQGPVIMP